MSRSLVRPLDRYVFAEFWRIFLSMAMGFPLLVILFDLTENIEKYLNRNLSKGQIALSYLYWLPDSMFMVLPAAVLFATVFAIGTFTRHSEITAAKASGVSFFRFIRPIFFGAALATTLGLALGELVPITNKKREDLLQERRFGRGGGNERFNFAYASDRGRVYKVAQLVVDKGLLEGLEIERRGRGPDYPTWVLAAQSASYAAGVGWTMRTGNMHIIPDSLNDLTFTFDSARSRRMAERPIELMATPRAPSEMGFRELGRFIAAMERSGADVNVLRVERMLKIAIPVTCIVIFLFGAPLATSTQRGGTAMGVGISLGTTVVFLMLVQLTKAIGGNGIIPPDLAAWIPGALFATIGVVLLTRVRT